MRPVPVAKFKKFLKSHNIEFQRTKGDHEIWDCKDDSLLRPVTFIGKEKEVPILHIKTNLKTLGISIKDFEQEIQNL